jgi:hypothetical protein
MGKGQGNSEGCSCSGQTGALACCAEEDRRCAKGAMGEGEGGEENGLAPFYGGRKRDSHLGRVISFSALVAHKKPAHGPFNNSEYFSSSCTDGMAYAIVAKWEQPLLPN